jgi:O-antigen ligase
MIENTPMTRSERSIDLPVLLALLVVPIIWPSLIRVGPVTLEPYHVALLALVGATVLQPRYLLMVFNILKENIVFFAAFAIYILFLSLSYMHNLESSALKGLIFKQIAFIVFGACVAARVAAMPNAGLTLYVGGIASLVTFFVIMQISAQAGNVSLIDALVSFGKTGDYKAWVYKFLKPALGAFSEQTVGSAIDFAASRKNNVASGLLVCLICYIVGHKYMEKSTNSNILHYGVVSVFLASLIFMLSRSVVLSLLLTALPIVAAKIFRGRDPLFIAGAFAAATSIMFVYLIVPQGIIDGLEARFFDDTTSFESRLSSYSEAFRVIEDNMLLGVGLGEEIEEHTVHNLFLYTWLQAGVFGFIAVFVFWGALVWKVLMHLWRLLMESRWNTNQEIALHAWIAAIPIMALLRVWVSGGGTLNFAAWFSVGVFLGLIYRHEGERTEPGRIDATGGYPAIPGLRDHRSPFR